MDDHNVIQPSLLPKLPRIKSVDGYSYTGGGATLLDFSAQTLNLPFGQPPKEIRDSVIESINAGSIFFSSRFGSPEFEILARKTIEISPPSINKINHKLSNGSDAVEVALKLAAYNNRNSTILCCKNAWHGETIATLALSSKNRSSYIGAYHGDILFSEESNLESLITLADEYNVPSTVIVDPIGFSCGLFEVSKLRKNLENLKTTCQANGHILIFDEIQCFGGFLGKGYFSYDIYEVEPDIITIGKAFGQGFPISACLYKDSLQDLDYNEAEFTYGGQPPACRAALSGIKYNSKHRNELDSSFSNWNSVAPNIAKALNPKSFILNGFFLTLTFEQTLQASHVFNTYMNKGIITRITNNGFSVSFKSPINVNEESLDRLLKITKDVSSSSLPKNRKNTRVLSFDDNKNMDYVKGIISRFSGITAFQRTPEQQLDIAKKLAKIGVSVPNYYSKKDIVFYTEIPGASLDAIKSIDNDIVRNTIYRGSDMLNLAHQNGLVIGDRWPGNTIVDKSNGIHFIDFDIGIGGETSRSSAFEHLFFLIQHAAYFSKNTDVSTIMTPFIGEFFRKWSDFGALGIYDEFRKFYSEPRKISNETSLDVLSYQKVLSIIDLNLNIYQPRAFKLRKNITARMKIA